MHIDSTLRNTLQKIFEVMTFTFVVALFFFFKEVRTDDIVTGPNEVHPLTLTAALLLMTAVVVYVEVIRFLYRQYIANRIITRLYRHLESVIDKSWTFGFSNEDGVRINRTSYGFEIEFLNLKFMDGLQAQTRWMLLEDRVLYGTGGPRAYTELTFKERGLVQALYRRLQQIDASTTRLASV